MKAQTDDCSGFKTFTIGGWGANCHGGNAGCYVVNNFSAAFGPNGISIGCNNSLRLTSAQAVNDFLPSGSTPAVLPVGNMINPGAGYQNVLAAQLVAVTLAVGFDEYDPNFSSNALLLGDQVITSGVFQGYTVRQFLQTANDVVGGCVTGFSPNDLNVTATMINQNYDNGTVDNGFLTCPNDPLMISIQTKVDVRCFGESNGSVSTTVSGGVEPYIYEWYIEEELSSTVPIPTVNLVIQRVIISNSPYVTDLAAGVYHLLVTDAAGDTASATIEITQPDELSIQLAALSVRCSGGYDGEAEVTATGGVAPYSYLWSTGDNTNKISGLSAGTYEVTVVCSHFCLAAGSVTITEPDPLETVSSSGNVSCFGGNDGFASVAVTGGTSPYTYSWSNGETTSSAAGLAAGSYQVTVTDANGCISSQAVEITQPDLLEGFATVSNVMCYGDSSGSAIITIQGGTSPYSVSWSSSPLADEGLPAGDYTVGIIDSHGCAAQVNFSVSEPPLLVAGGGSVSVTCYGLNNGSAWVDPSGGVPPYNQLWNTGSTDVLVQNLTPGTYSATVTDANGCLAEMTASITQPDQLAVNVSFDPVSCYGGTTVVAANVSGGTEPYAYYWNGATTQGQNTFNSLVGNVSVQIVDANGCITSTNGQVTLASCQGFVTVTQGGWGAKCAGGNWGCYLDAKFSSTFPGGLTIGACGRYIKLTSAAAVRGFLPNGGTPAVLANGTLTNPTNKTVKNTLAGQVVALTLNVAFDAANPAFAPSTTKLGDLIIATGSFAGMSVSQLLAEANKALGGCGSYSVDALNNACDKVNNCYDNGTVNVGYLACPCPSGNLTVTDNSGNTNLGLVMDIQETTGLLQLESINLYPNPSYGDATLAVQFKGKGVAMVRVLNTMGQQVLEKNIEPRENEPVTLIIERQHLSGGLYFILISSEEHLITSKGLVFK